MITHQSFSLADGQSTAREQPRSLENRAAGGFTHGVVDSAPWASLSGLKMQIRG